MSLIADELHEAFSSRVKRKTNATRKLRVTEARAKAKRVIGGSPEVMVKVTGFGKGAGHIKAHLEYISRNGNVELESSRGEVLAGRDEVSAFFKDWATSFARDGGRQMKNARDTMHMVLSMPETVEPEAVKNAVREFAKTTFGKNHEYVFALHTDEPHPHCHLAVKCRGFDGNKLRSNPAALEAWRNTFAAKLREQGVDAEATPRHSRGVIRKAEKGAVRHIADGDKTHKARVPKVRAAKIKEAAQELAAEVKTGVAAEHPKAIKAKASIATKKAAWLAVASALETAETRITFNNQEAKNARPNYDRIDPAIERRGQRHAALYQSNPKALGLEAPPGAFTGLRNLPGVGLVHNKRNPQVLLSADAPNRMGGQANADPEMRWPRIGDSRDSGRERSQRQLVSDLPPSVENKQLAAGIRAFVASMPAVITEREETKARLAGRFKRTPEAIKSADVSPPDSRQQKGADVAPAPENAPRDVER